MIKTRNLNSKFIDSYRSRYGSRRQQHNMSKINTLVNFSSLFPRKGLDIDHLQTLTPEWKKNLQYMIRNAGKKD